MQIRNFSRSRRRQDVPDLTRLQREAYERFLQTNVPPHKRKKDVGLESVLREIFPIENFDKTISIEYIEYTLGKPRYTPDECRQLRLTYGMPFRIRVRLNKEEPIEEEVYLGDMPVMLGGGEFIINGAERVIVSQLHRSPGVDFLQDTSSSEAKLHACRIIPERGSWIEINVTKKDRIVVRIDQSGKMPATMFLRALDERFSTDEDILAAFHPITSVKLKDATKSKLVGKRLVGDIVDKETGQVLMSSLSLIGDEQFKQLKRSNLTKVRVIEDPKDPLILNSLEDDPTSSTEEALMRIYARLRPGNPAKIDKARDLFHEKFFDMNRYRLGQVGRFRLNRKFGENVPVDHMTLRAEDIVNCLKYLLMLRDGEGQLDDIDHLGNRRIRTLDELACDELRKGFLKLRRTVTERMSLKDPAELTPRVLINSKTISSAIDYFFGRSELSQVVDQTNPLAQLTHERRLSALGPGGLNRKRAGFEVRDVHISHYGRICPIETPEGTNIGLISSLCVHAAVDELGFLITPYRRVKNGKVSGSIVYLRADQEAEALIAPADIELKPDGSFLESEVIARYGGDFVRVKAKDVDYMDIQPEQLVGVSASLIPFLEHNDANRALMGSNMQRQAVPLIRTEQPFVTTGLERSVAKNSGMVVVARSDGVVKEVTADYIVVGSERYNLRKFVGLNERTCLNQKPIVNVGDKVKRGDVIADGAATKDGVLALGKNVLVGFMPWEGYNFEDAIVISEKLVKDDRFTSIHIEEFEVEIRETKLGREEFTRDIPNVSERALRNLDEDGIIQVGTKVGPGDILVGKITPKSKSELSPEEKLLYAIFGRAGEDVKNDSLEVPSGVEGIVIDTKKFARRTHLSEAERREADRKAKLLEQKFDKQIAQLFRLMVEEMTNAAGHKLKFHAVDEYLSFSDDTDDRIVLDFAQDFSLDHLDLDAATRRKVRGIFEEYHQRIEDARYEKEREIDRLKRGDELPSGVLEMVKVYVATKRTLSAGDKMAGRHGNKGVIAKIVPEEDMPYLEDGTPLEILLNPLGVPSRMNVGQILETHLGWAAKVLGFQAVTPVFDGATEDSIHECLAEAGLPADGKCTLFDGRTGEPLDQKVTVGYIYMMKLHHLVDDKVHARATGPYSLITQQPLGGKARFGGQRFGEMEVWALEAYGAAYILQELLTVKSDDVEGRTKIYEAMVKGVNTLEAGTPVSFEVLINEIRGLALNMQLEKKKL